MDSSSSRQSSNNPVFTNEMRDRQARGKDPYRTEEDDRDEEVYRLGGYRFDKEKYIFPFSLPLRLSIFFSLHLPLYLHLSFICIILLALPSTSPRDKNIYKSSLYIMSATIISQNHRKIHELIRLFLLSFFLLQ